jgi:hypothetical protein
LNKKKTYNNKIVEEMSGITKTCTNVQMDG